MIEFIDWLMRDNSKKDYIVSKKITAKFLVVIDLDDVLDFKFDLKKFQNLQFFTG